jgi:hypothetical protein
MNVSQIDVIPKAVLGAAWGPLLDWCGRALAVGENIAR